MGIGAMCVSVFVILSLIPFLKVLVKKKLMTEGTEYMFAFK